MSLLDQPAALAQVEALMRRLVAGARDDTIGRIGNEHLATGGKRLRARLALAATAALGKPAGDGVAWAAACELLHNATLIHDDLQDGDKYRRGNPTVWFKHGSTQAINAGDLLLMLAFAAIRESAGGSDVRAALSHVLADGAATVVRGQAAELELPAIARDPARAATLEAAYTATIEGKTAALFELPVTGAALVAGRDETQAHVLGRALRPLGTLFQIQDDVIDLYGEKGRETHGNDIREGKITLLVVKHIEQHPADRDWLLDILGTPREHTKSSDVDEVLRRFREGGALTATFERFDALSSAIANHPDLAATPELHTVARELIAAIMGPLQEVERVARAEGGPGRERM